MVERSATDGADYFRSSDDATNADLAAFEEFLATVLQPEDNVG